MAAAISPFQYLHTVSAGILSKDFSRPVFTTEHNALRIFKGSTFAGLPMPALPAVDAGRIPP